MKLTLNFYLHNSAIENEILGTYQFFYYLHKKTVGKTFENAQNRQVNLKTNRGFIFFKSQVQLKDQPLAKKNHRKSDHGYSLNRSSTVLKNKYSTIFLRLLRTTMGLQQCYSNYLNNLSIYPYCIYV